MRKLDIAEVILSLAADRDRATAIAGDLAEESRGSALRFWWLVAQTSVLQTARQLSAAPFAMFFATIWELLSEMTVPIIISAPHYWTGPLQVLRPTPTVEGWVLMWWLFTPLLLGWTSARQNPGREYPVIVTWLCLHAILNVGTSLFLYQSMGVQGTVANEILVGLAWFVVFASVSFLLASGGAAMVRSKSLRGVAHA